MLTVPVPLMIAQVEGSATNHLPQLAVDGLLMTPLFAACCTDLPG
jgi:hypothetical protein